MFSNTAYEALYQYLGLVFHSKSIEIITSQRVFLGLILLIFGFMFFITSAEFFSRYVPGVLIKRRQVPLSRFVKIVFLLFISISFLRVGGTTSVKQFSGKSWDENPYIKKKLENVSPEYQVSLLFDLMSRSAEEVAALISRVVDKLFSTTHSQLDAPNFFFKAIMYAGSHTIEDPKLQRIIQYYTDECFSRFIPYAKDYNKASWFEKFYRREPQVDSELSQIVLETHDKRHYTCLQLKNEVRDGLREYAIKTGGGIGSQVEKELGKSDVAYAWGNFETANALLNYYRDSKESRFLRIQKGAELPTTGGGFFQNLNRIFSFDGAATMIGSIFGYDLQGVTLAASRAEEFSQNLARAPHVAGFIKMMAIGIFPWLMFFVVAGYWRVLVYWFLIYFSVLLWTPIWTVLYHVMIYISQSTEVMGAFKTLTDGISLYSAGLIESRMYHLFAVYSWLQLLTGTLFTGMVLFFLKPALGDSDSPTSPDFIDGSGSALSTGGQVVGAAAKVGGALL